MKTVIPATPGTIAYVRPSRGQGLVRVPVIAWFITTYEDDDPYLEQPCILPVGPRGVLHNFERVVVGGADE